MSDSPERRRRRSDDPGLATRYQLEQVVEDFDLDTCILVDESGTLIQGVGQAEDFEEVLARETPRLAHGSRCRLLFSRLNEHRRVRPNQISACEFRSDGSRYFVTAVGSASTMRDVGMYRAILGIRRIRKQSGGSATALGANAEACFAPG